jgi:putative ABC transport system ATP-binding protein
MLALVGPSGAGKSTLLNCLGLLDRLDTGRIVVDGADITRLGSRDRRRFRRDRLGYLFQSYALIENATIEENLDVALGTGPFGRRRRRLSYADALGRVGLTGRGREPVYRLSGGEQQRVALARLLLRAPAVVLADEPTGALDPANAAMVIGVLREISTRGCAVVIATHNADVEKACDQRLDIAHTPAPA